MCLFCKIVNHEIESDIIFENKKFIVFKDIYPKAPVHLLLVPKKHIKSINELEDSDSSLISEIFFLARKMAEKEGVKESGYRLIFNVGKGGGQEVDHLHLHLLGGWKIDKF